jgi:hypothetical protein
MRKTLFTVVSLAVSTLLCSQAFAEAAVGEPQVVAETASAEVSLTDGSMAASGDAAAEAPAEESSDPPAWFRMDHDSFALQLWFGATHSLGGIDIATDIYVNSATAAEFDIGPAFTLDSVILTPMIGVTFDWSQKRMVNIVPQLYTIFSSGDIYAENWIQVFLNSPLTDDAGDDFYTRLFVTFKVGEHVAVGPQVEATLAINDNFVAGAGAVPDSGREAGLVSLPIGGVMNLNYGAGNTLGLFLGYETQSDAQLPPTDRALAGRFTFIKTW